MSEVRASVAMAVYNGEKYIKEQIDSILEVMGKQDELVISYDASTDATRQIIGEYERSDSRVRVLENKNPGVQNNFNNAVMGCRGKYIFLSDQDDKWIGDKITLMVEKFEQTGADLVVHDGYMADGALNPYPKTFFERCGTYNSPIRNIIQCNFWGCCMAFRSDLREVVCPFPNKNKVGHDLWLGVVIGFCGKIERLGECLILHRLHGNNVTSSRRSLPVVLRHRLSLLGYLGSRAGRIIRWKTIRNPVVSNRQQ